MPSKIDLHKKSRTNVLKESPLRKIARRIRYQNPSKINHQIDAKIDAEKKEENS